ncbi:MAG: apolipoprotein N-acyltransferase [Myxococcales bacterium]|nr:apolipoprotein N-acyltransferase [Myxococcales bacterium]
MTPASRSRMERVRAWLDLPARPGRTGVVAGVGLAVVGGLLWVLAAPPFGLWPLAWLAAAPTLIAIDRAPTPRRAGLLGALTALTFTIGGFPWMVHLLQVNAGLPVPVAVLGLFILGAIHGLVWLVGARLIRGLRDRRRAHRRGPWPLAVAGPLGLVVIEVVLWTPFPFSMSIGVAGVDGLRALTAFVGPAGVTALLVAAPAALLDATARPPPGLRRRVRWYPAIGVAVLALALVVGSRRTTPDGPVRTVRIGVVQPNQRVDVVHDVRARIDHLAALQQATADLEVRGAELVVWSEAAYPFALPREQTEDFAQGDRRRIRHGFTVPVVVGAITARAGGPPWNSAILLERDGRFAGRHDKVHRMIGSEYNPLIEWFPAAEKVMPAGAGSYAGGGAAVALETSIDGIRLRLAVAVCLEDVLPAFGRDLAALDPDLVVNVTNDTWFGGAEPLQHEALARFRPVEIGVPLVRAVNTGPSSVIDRDGRFLARTAVREGGEPETLLVDVPLGPRARSFYAGAGGTLVRLVAWAALLWWLLPVVAGWARRRWRARVAARPPAAGGGAGAPARRGGRGRQRRS